MPQKPPRKRSDELPGGTVPAAPAFGDDEETSVDPPLDELIGTTILGQFEVLERIGGGGYGTVYLCDQLGLSRKAILKVVNTENREEAQVVLHRFDREAKILAALEHPHFIRLYNYGTLDDGRPFLAMEYGGDTNVADEIKKLKKLPPERALLIAEQVCDALEEAHRRGIVHRDLKPHNILLGRRDGHDWVKVVDLGIARVLDSAVVDDGAKLTGVGLVIGTPMYFSPEQCHGVGLDGRSDLYTVGVVLYEMLSGKLPLHGVSNVDYIRAHVVDVPEPLRKNAPEIPASVEAIVMRALRKKAPERFGSAAEMRDAIREARSHLKPQSKAPLKTPPKPVKKVKAPARRRWLLAGAALAACSAVLVAVLLVRSEAPATLVIHVTPASADVVLDGRHVVPGKIRVNPGRHRVTVRADGFQDQKQILHVKPDETVPVEVTLIELGQ